MSSRCTVCGQLHDDLPDICADRPDQWWGVPQQERSRRLKLSTDTCILDDEHYFVRGIIELPIHDHPRRFGFGVWVSLKCENFEAYLKNFDSVAIGPFFGWLCTRLSCYAQDTLLLKTMVHFRGGGLRPTIEVESSDHPLAVDQRDGISLARAWEIVHCCMDEPT